MHNPTALIRRVPLRRALPGALVLLLILLASPLAFAGVKLKKHSAHGTDAHLRQFLFHARRCMGDTTLDVQADGTLTIGAEPDGGDNKFAELVRTIIGGDDVEIELGRSIPDVLVGQFRADANGVTTGTQSIDLDDLEKFPRENECVSTIWSVIMNELWEVHFAVADAKANPGVGGTYARADPESIAKENEVLADQDPANHGQRQANTGVQRVLSRRLDGGCTIIEMEAFIPFKKVNGDDVFMVFTIELEVDTTTRRLKEARAEELEVAESVNQAKADRTVVTNPDPSVIVFDPKDGFETRFENYPDDPDSRPGHVEPSPSGFLFISEEIKNTIEVVDSASLTPVARISDPALSNPQGLAYHFLLGELFVASHDNDRILVFDAADVDDVVKLRELRHPRLDGPTDLALIHDGRYILSETPPGAGSPPLLYVANSNRHEVLVLGLDGRMIGSLTAPELLNPSGLAVDPEGNVYVSSFDTDSVVVFGPGGEVRRILADSRLDGPQGIGLELAPVRVDAVLVAGKESRNVVRFNADGSVESFTHPDNVCPKGLTKITTLSETQPRQPVTGTPTFFKDCNENGIPDSQDIADGTSLDIDTNGVPDECEVGSVTWIFSGMAEGGTITVTIDGFFASCTVAISTLAGESSETVVGNLAAALNADPCLADQDIVAAASGDELVLSGFSLTFRDVTEEITDPGLRHDMPLLTIPTLSGRSLLVLLLVLGSCGWLLARRAWLG